MSVVTGFYPYEIRELEPHMDQELRESTTELGTKPSKLIVRYDVTVSLELKVMDSNFYR